MASKSGANSIHGSLFEYFRNDVLSANDFFSNSAGKARPMLRYNQFGGTIGGPIIKNRTFFFFAYEGLREVPTVVTTSVPTALQRAGDFSDVFKHGATGSNFRSNNHQSESGRAWSLHPQPIPR